MSTLRSLSLLIVLSLGGFDCRSLPTPEITECPPTLTCETVCQGDSECLTLCHSETGGCVYPEE